jgi:hypothetical protein
VLASETKSVVLAIDSDVLLVAALELLDACLNVLHTTWITHLLAGEVAMETSPVPVTGNWLGVESDLGTEFFRNAVEEESSDPEVVTHCRILACFAPRDWVVCILSIPAQGPTWNSHCAGITSALVPAIWMPAFKQAL